MGDAAAGREVNGSGARDVRWRRISKGSRIKDRSDRGATRNAALTPLALWSVVPLQARRIP